MRVYVLRKEDIINNKIYSSMTMCTSLDMVSIKGFLNVYLSTPREKGLNIYEEKNKTIIEHDSFKEVIYVEKTEAFCKFDSILLKEYLANHSTDIGIDIDDHKDSLKEEIIDHIVDNFEFVINQSVAVDLANDCCQ